MPVVAGEPSVHPALASEFPYSLDRLRVASAVMCDRGQQMALLRMLGRDVHSNYGPTADTGGLMQNQARTIYAYPSSAWTRCSRANVVEDRQDCQAL